jgi:GR25 family glycosyltransferase involved in LPS biosynthesis
MSAFTDYFQAIIVINRDSRHDRWQHVTAQCRQYGFHVTRFRAHEGTPSVGKEADQFDGNLGCTSSHRGALELIAYLGELREWKRALILEDDFEVVDPNPAKAFQHDAHAGRTLPFNEQFAAIIGEVPTDYDMLYLGGQYGEPPQSRVSAHVIRINAMLTTTAYAVTPAFARRLCPHIYGHGPIDSLYGPWNRACKCYCLQPRLFVQYTNESDIQHRVMDNSQCMLDPNHERMV